jgi:hypothetical protein
MIVSTWKGWTYGIRVELDDVSKYFPIGVTSVELEIAGTLHRFPLSRKFWSSCPEIRGAAIGRWFQSEGIQTWPRYRPHKLELVPIGKARFRLQLKAANSV